MSQARQYRLRTASALETEALGELAGRTLGVRTVVGLVGELGGGKTCFVRGLARGLGADPREVASPTFVYLTQYAGGRLPLWHVDLYRLLDMKEPILEEAYTSIGLYDALASDAITAVEWWDPRLDAEVETLIVVEFSIETADVRTIGLTLRGAGVDDFREALTAAAARSQRSR